ncbi:helix-turn-helix transcriptional regulator [Streptomyces klenkii]|uniref:transcriptional regulator n=1 Tax=Streptomyces klenkii TaxID=1420899 RepID=UPI0033ACB094
MTWRDRRDHGSTADEAGGRLARHATASLAGLLAERGMTRKDLAESMGVSPGRVSQILSGDENLTMRSLAAVADALDVKMEISFSEPATAGCQESPAHRALAKTYR